MTNPKLIIEVAGDDRALKRTLKSADTQVKGFSQGLRDAGDQFTVKSKRAGAIGFLRFGAGGAVPLTAGLIAGAQASRELASSLETTGAAASTTTGRLKNVGSALLSGNFVGAFKAAGQEIELTKDELQKLIDTGATMGDLGAAKAGLAAAGFGKLAEQIGTAEDAARSAAVQLALLNAPQNLVVPGENIGPGFKGAPAAEGGLKFTPELFSGLSPKVREALLDAQINATEATDAAILRALKLQEKELRGLLKNAIPSERLDIKESLAGVTGAIDAYNDAVKSAADAAAAAARAAAEAARRAAEQAAREALARRRAATEARIAARNAAQFTALGLTATGDERAPGAAHLRAQLRTLGEDITGTSLDTPKLRARLAKLREVLVGGLGVVGRDVRLAARDLMDGIADELDKGAIKVQTRSLAVGKVLSGLGLSRDEERALRARLANVTAGGRTLAGGGTVGAFGYPVTSGAGVTVVNTTIQLDGKTVATNTTAHQRDTRERNGTQKRG